MNIAKIIETATKYTKSNSKSNIQQIDDFIVFDAIRHISSKYQSKYTTFRELEREAISEKNFEKLIAIYFTKQTVKTTILFQNLRIQNKYREAKRTKYFTEFQDATHLLTITYRVDDEEDIFKIAEKNKEIKSKFNAGMQKMRVYFKKYFNFRLKYIYSKEITKKGFLHFHIIIQLPSKFRKNFKEMIKKLKKWFGTEENGVDLKYIKTKDRKKATQYVMKYISKQNEEMFYEIENTKIFFTTKQKIIRNLERRIFSYSYKRKPKIKKTKTQQITIMKEYIDRREVHFEQERIPKITKNMSEKTKEIIEKILTAFEKYEYKIYDTIEKIKEFKKISEEIEAEREAVIF